VFAWSGSFRLELSTCRLDIRSTYHRTLLLSAVEKQEAVFMIPHKLTSPPPTTNRTTNSLSQTKSTNTPSPPQTSSTTATPKTPTFNHLSKTSPTTTATPTSAAKTALALPPNSNLANASPQTSTSTQTLSTAPTQTKNSGSKFAITSLWSGRFWLLDYPIVIVIVTLRSWVWMNTEGLE
jgi:hypothetical protein